jgi:hypothetical protein
MTPDEVRKMMKEAVKAVQEADVPDDLRVVAFEKSFDALIGGSDTAAPPAQEDDSRPLAVPMDGPSLAAIASRFGVDRGSIDETYYVDGEALGLAIAPARFQRTKAAATQQVALLLGAGRQAGGWDDWTAVATIRSACRDYGFLDEANFATTIKRMGDVFSFRGRGRQLEVRVTRPGYERAADLVRELGRV